MNVLDVKRLWVTSRETPPQREDRSPFLYSSIGAPKGAGLGMGEPSNASSAVLKVCLGPHRHGRVRLHSDLPGQGPMFRRHARRCLTQAAAAAAAAGRASHVIPARPARTRTTAKPAPAATAGQRGQLFLGASLGSRRLGRGVNHRLDPFSCPFPPPARPEMPLAQPHATVSLCARAGAQRCVFGQDAAVHHNLDRTPGILAGSPSRPSSPVRRPLGGGLDNRDPTGAKMQAQAMDLAAWGGLQQQQRVALKVGLIAPLPYP